MSRCSKSQRMAQNPEYTKARGAERKDDEPGKDETSIFRRFVMLRA